MMRPTMLYETDEMTGLPVPVWMLIEGIDGVDWDSTFHVHVDAPFEACSIDEMDPEALAVSVPDHVYVRNANDPLAVGIHLPSLRSYIERIAAVSEHPFSHSDIRRLMLRISDLEDVLQYELRRLSLERIRER